MSRLVSYIKDKGFFYVIYLYVSCTIEGISTNDIDLTSDLEAYVYVK